MYLFYAVVIKKNLFITLGSIWSVPVLGNDVVHRTNVLLPFFLLTR